MFLTGRVSGELWNLRRQHNNSKKLPQNSHQMAITSIEASHNLVSALSEWGLHADVQAASLVLRARTRVECPEDTLRGLM